MLETLDRCTTLLKHFASSAVTFATADNSIAATGIGTAFPTAGTKLYVSGATNAGNNITFTVSSATANKIIVTETVTAESAGAAVVVEQEYQGAWKQTYHYGHLVGPISASQNCTVFVDFSDSKGTTPDDITTINISGGVTDNFNLIVRSFYSRLRVRNGGTNQTTMKVYMHGQTV